MSKRSVVLAATMSLTLFSAASLLCDKKKERVKKESTAQALITPSQKSSGRAAQRLEQEVFPTPDPEIESLIDDINLSFERSQAEMQTMMDHMKKLQDRSKRVGSAIPAAAALKVAIKEEDYSVLIEISDINIVEGTKITRALKRGAGTFVVPVEKGSLTISLHPELVAISLKQEEKKEESKPGRRFSEAAASASSFARSIPLVNVGQAKISYEKARKVLVISVPKEAEEEKEISLA